MNSHVFRCGLAATLVLGATLFGTPVALAQHEHHSNTLSKMGHAIEYGVRKTGKNISNTTHRAIGHNSVERRNHNGRHYNRVLTSQGKLRPVHHNH